MLLEVLDGKTDVLALIVGWLRLADWKALSAANRYTARSELRRVVFSRCVLRLPPPAPRAAEPAASSLRVPWSDYVAGCFLAASDPQMLASVTCVRIPYSCLNLLEMLRFLPSLRAVRFWAYPYESDDRGEDMSEHEPAINVAALCQLAPKMRELHAADMDVALAELPMVAAAASLEVLDLSLSDMDALEPLRSLTSLRWLSLWRTEVADLSFLENTPLLEYLDLAESRATDFWPVRSLARLETLNINKNWVASAAFLQSLPALRTLKMAGVGAMDPLHLSFDSPHLEVLQLQSTRLADLEFAHQLPELVDLDIRWTETTDRRPLTALQQLQRLLIDVFAPAGGDRELVADVVAAELSSEWLRSLRSLKKLRVYRRDFVEEFVENEDPPEVPRDNPLEIRRVDGAFLLDLASEALKSVDLPALVDYAPLVYLAPTLRHLRLQQWTTEDLQQLLAAGELPALRRLTLALPPTHEIVDLQPLESFVQLTHLELMDVLFEELSPLAALVSLEKLDLGLLHRGKRLIARRHVRHHTTFDFLASLTELQELSLTGRVDFKDASVLSGLTRLRKLWLGASKVENVEPLAPLTNLELLDLSSTPVANVESLVSLEALEQVWLPDVADCAVFRREEVFRRLGAIWHPDDYNCLWTHHKF